jgi:exopolyphosphatase/guanosine-5'-triphosphate,3'-diphosphate pyrophosphatase
VTRVAALDCGTNSLRLLVADLDGAGGKRDVHREMRVVRLGQGVDRTGRLAAEALERTRTALVDYAQTCRDLGVEATRLVATSATRDADNREEFTGLVQDTLGVAPEVVTGAQEAALSFDGATRDLDAADGPFLVLDIGGGSTEFVLGTGGRSGAVRAALSVDIGCVRLTERHLPGDPPSGPAVAAARADIRAALDRVRAAVPVEQARTAVGLAGSVTTLAALALELPAYDAARIHLTRLSAATVAALTTQLLGMTREQRAVLPVMHPGRVDVIAAGALILSTALQELGLDEILVSEADILDGIAWSVLSTDEGAG